MFVRFLKLDFIIFLELLFVKFPKLDFVRILKLVWEDFRSLFLEDRLQTSMVGLGLGWSEMVEIWVH